MKRAVLAIGLMAGVTGCSASGRMIVRDPVRAIEYDALVAQAPIGPEENIHATALQRGEHASLHVVRIRDREQPHIHTRYDLTVLLLHGTGTLWLDGQPLAMRAGDTAFIPRNTPHYFVNESSDPAAALVTFAPAFDGPDTAQVP